jgi:hypothetical protein
MWKASSTKKHESRGKLKECNWQVGGVEVAKLYTLHLGSMHEKWQTTSNT